MGGQQFLDVADLGEHGGHGARLGLLHEGAAPRREPETVLERHHAGDARGDELADAVADDDARLDAPVLPQRGERVLDREQRGLGVPGLVDRSFVGVLRQKRR